MHGEDAQRSQDEASKRVTVLRYRGGQLSRHRHIVKINDMWFHFCDIHSQLTNVYAREPSRSKTAQTSSSDSNLLLLQMQVEFSSDSSSLTHQAIF